MSTEKFWAMWAIGSMVVVTLLSAVKVGNLNSEIRSLKGQLKVERATPNCVEVEIRTDPAWPQIDAVSRIHGVPTNLARPVVEAALAHGLDPYVFARLVRVESSWRSYAISHRGAYGLAQVRLSTARGYDPDLEPKDLLDPFTSAWVGAWYYRRMLDRYDGDHFTALRAYNAGPTRISRDDRISRRYAFRILEGS